MADRLVRAAAQGQAEVVQELLVKFPDKVMNFFLYSVCVCSRRLDWLILRMFHTGGCEEQWKKQKYSMQDLI